MLTNCAKRQQALHVGRVAAISSSLGKIDQPLPAIKPKDGTALMHGSAKLMAPHTCISEDVLKFLVILSYLRSKLQKNSLTQSVYPEIR